MKLLDPLITAAVIFGAGLALGVWSSLEDRREPVRIPARRPSNRLTRRPD